MKTNSDAGTRGRGDGHLKRKRFRFACLKRNTAPRRQRQRQILLRRSKRIRREIEQQLRDRASFNSLQKSRGQAGIGNDPELLALLACVDQQIQQIRDLR